MLCTLREPAIGNIVGRSPSTMWTTHRTRPVTTAAPAWFATLLVLTTLYACARAPDAGRATNPPDVHSPQQPPGEQPPPQIPKNSSAQTTDTSPTAPEATTNAASEDFLAKCRAAAAYSRQHDGEVMLVLLHGQPVFEDAAPDFTVRTPHLLASGSKSFVGVAAMCAVEDGLLSLDEPVSATIHEWQSDPQKSKVTIRQLLSLASGLEGLSAKIDSAASAREAGITDRAQASIGARMLAAPGERFIYGPSSFYVFGELLKRKLTNAKTGDADINAYLGRRIFTPLGIRPLVQRDGVGNPNFAGGCRIGATDWARFGELIRNGGVHEGVSVVSPDLVAQLSKATGPNPRYGLTWWLLSADGSDAEDDVADTMAADRLERRDGPIARRLAARLREREEARAARSQRSAPSAPTPAGDGTTGDGSVGGSVAGSVGFMAAGKGKQRLYVLPDHGLTIVRFGALNGSRDFHDAEFLDLLLGDLMRGTSR